MIHWALRRKLPWGTKALWIPSAAKIKQAEQGLLHFIHIAAFSKYTACVYSSPALFMELRLCADSIDPNPNNLLLICLHGAVSLFMHPTTSSLSLSFLMSWCIICMSTRRIEIPVAFLDAASGFDQNDLEAQGKTLNTPRMPLRLPPLLFLNLSFSLNENSS